MFQEGRMKFGCLKGGGKKIAESSRKDVRESKRIVVKVHRKLVHFFVLEARIQSQV
jgi:hypothetical protein